MQEILPPQPATLHNWFAERALQALPWLLRLARPLRPIFRLSGMVWVTRYDDVRQVFLDDLSFTVPYGRNADFVVGAPPAPAFVLGMADTPAYRTDLAAMHEVMTEADLPCLAKRADHFARVHLPPPGGTIDIVAFTRRVVFDVILEYFGIPDLPNDQILLWVTRLFIFQLTYKGPDSTRPADAVAMAPLLRNHVAAAIADRKAAAVAVHDVLGRCLDLQRRGDSRYDDLAIRTLITGCLIALPQVPMLMPNAIEQLLRRPQALAAAQTAAAAGQTALVGRYLFEAARFDPLAPGLNRVATVDAIIAPGTFRATRVKTGETLLVCFASAMRDGCRVPSPDTFDPDRPESDYIAFGYGRHRCFGEAINHVVLPAILTVLLERPIDRVPGAAGRLRKQTVFAKSLMVTR